MTGFWLASYIVLWVLVAILSFLTVGLLQQVGVLNGRLEEAGPLPMKASAETLLPAPEDDGPAFGSSLPRLDAETINGFGPLASLIHSNKGPTFFIFMSPMCESCQYLVDPLNQVQKEGSDQIQTIVIMRADEEACRAFLSIFPLSLPVVCDDQRTITMSFGVHHAPFGVVYDRHGILRRKGLIQKKNDFLTVLGDSKEP